VTDFLIEGRLQAYDGQRLFQERRWQSKRQRDFM
jgi:hypothetical protein